jgi:hypothetical protein
MSPSMQSDAIAVLERRLQALVREVAGGPMRSLGLELPMPTLQGALPTADARCRACLRRDRRSRRAASGVSPARRVWKRCSGRPR